MNQERLTKVIIAPVISEKATLVGETRRQVVFEVLPDATKAEIKAAVELLFKEQKVQVGAVNVVNVKGKQKRHGRFIGRRKSIKKAYVSLLGDGDINFVEGVA
jgi:large subunit ribosomal protein L23